MKRIDEKFLAAFKKAAKSVDFKEVASITKEDAEQYGAFKFILSKEVEDRAGDIVRVDGIDLARYKKNPVVLFAHDYNQLPVGKAVDVKVEGKKLIAEGVFASHDFAQTLRKMYDEGFIKTVSIGFIPKDMEQIDGSFGFDIKESELLEFSIVPVPCNPEALDMLGKEAPMAITKGVFANKVKTEDTDQEDDEEFVEPTEEELAEAAKEIEEMVVGTDEEESEAPEAAEKDADSDEEGEDDDSDEEGEEAPENEESDESDDEESDDEEGSEDDEEEDELTEEEKAFAAMAKKLGFVKDCPCNDTPLEDSVADEEDEDDEEEMSDEEKMIAAIPKMQDLATQLGETLHFAKGVRNNKND